MNALPREHVVDWLAPAPLWGMRGADPVEPSIAPAVVRIDGDDFMEQFAALLSRPTAGAELWGARPGVKAGDKEPNVLYQSLHGCYALVCASLTCRVAGRPEKAVTPSSGQSVGFVIRRVDAVGESAWIPAGAGEGAWMSASATALAKGEELIPLFPVPVGNTGRRVWAGLIPTASRETYQPGATDSEDAVEALVGELDSGPGSALKTVPLVQPPGDAVGTVAAQHASIQAALGLALFLSGNLLPTARRKSANLVAELGKITGGPALGDALKRAGLVAFLNGVWSHQSDLLGEKITWPDFTGLYPALPMDDDTWSDISTAVAVALKAKLPASGAKSAKSRGAAVPKFAIAFDAGPVQQYVVRCVYVRDNKPDDARDKCRPVVSQPSASFSIAPVHHPGAPARTIRIPMPVDVSVAGLSKFRKNVGFVLSGALNAKVKALTGKKLKDIDDGNVSDGGDSDGEVCTFAIPIIMLCAMIVLYIFLALLNIVFFWMPLVKICLPLPKGKP